MHIVKYVYVILLGLFYSNFYYIILFLGEKGTFKVFSFFIYSVNSAFTFKGTDGNVLSM